METRVDESLRGSGEASFGVDEGFGVGDRVARLDSLALFTRIRKKRMYLDVESVCAVCAHKNLHGCVVW